MGMAYFNNSYNFNVTSTNTNLQTHSFIATLLRDERTKDIKQETIERVDVTKKFIFGPKRSRWICGNP